MAIRVLGIDIMSYLKGDGFNDADKQVGKLQGTLGGIKSIANSSLGQMAIGYFGVSSAVSQYEKAVEAANYQIEQETKLYSTMRGQGFRDDQIDNIKKYAGELQNLGVVGDAVTLAGAQQLATYNLTEDNLKKLMPAMQDIIVQQKGLAATGGDAVGAANMLAKGLLGQTGELLQAGISLTDYQTEIIKTGTQSEKVAALVEAVTMNVGEQNKTFLETPEGKIVAVKNRVGDLYETMGMMFRESRGEVYEFFGNNLDIIEKYLKIIVGTVVNTGRGIANVASSVFNAFKSMPEEVKTAIGLVAGFFAITTFPIAGGVLILEDLFTAFEGGDSLIEESYNKLMSFLDIDLTFDESIETIKELWETFEKGNGVQILFEGLRGTIDALTYGLGLLADGTKTVLGALGLAGTGIKSSFKAIFDDDYTWEDAKDEMSNSWENGSGEMFRSGISGAKERTKEFALSSYERGNTIADLYTEGQKNIEKINIEPLEKKEIKDIPVPKLSVNLPSKESKKLEVNYKPSDINITITNSSDNPINPLELQSILEQNRELELKTLKQQIGGDFTDE